MKLRIKLLRRWTRRLPRLPRWLRLRRRTKRRLVTLSLVMCLVLSVVLMTRHTQQPTVSMATYAPLLDTIAKGESGGNYNAYYAHADNTTVHFTDMTVAEVMNWQKSYVDQGSFSSAVGRYQIIRPTMAKLVDRLHIDTNARFDPALQDKMAVSLLEQRGSVEFAGQKISREQFAANIAQEWAALPKVIGANPTQSYYAADGVNASRISIDEVFRAMAGIALQ
jgi:muramidase (phage lysozyme)